MVGNKTGRPVGKRIHEIRLFEMANVIGSSTDTARRYALALEDAGFEIEHYGENKRRYDERVMEAVRLMGKIRSKHPNLESAAKSVMFLVGDKRYLRQPEINDLPPMKKDIPVFDRIGEQTREKMLSLVHPKPQMEIPAPPQEAITLDLSAQKTVSTVYMLSHLEIGQRAVIAGGPTMGARCIRLADGLYWDTKDKTNMRPVQLGGNIIDEQWILLPQPKPLSYKEAFDAFINGQGIYSVTNPGEIFKLGTANNAIIATADNLKKAWHIVNPAEVDYNWEAKVR